MVLELFKNTDSSQKNGASLKKDSSGKRWTAKAPGSLMLMGEHAVLYGKPALVAAINRSIQVTLKPRSDKIIILNSSLGKLEISLDALPNLELSEPFKFVLATLQSYNALLTSGFELKIESEFSEKIGFGSSAAVVVALVKVLNDFMGSDPNADWNIFQTSKAIVLKVQGQGSGADVAASVFGGLIYYHAEPHSENDKNDKSDQNKGTSSLKAQIESLIGRETQSQSPFPKIIALYSGSKIKTPMVISKVQEAYKKFPLLYDRIFEAMAICTQAAREAILKQDWMQLGELMNVHQGFQSALDISNSILESLVYQLRNSPGILGAKISGAGLGDCVIGIGAELKFEKGIIETEGQEIIHQELKVEPIILELTMGESK